MGYEHRVLKATCGKCKRETGWRAMGAQTFSSRWTCKHCRAVNVLKLPNKWPDLPRFLYTGVSKHELFKMYVVPPNAANESWAQPYSIRSFVSQASERFGGCIYYTSKRGVVMDEPVFHDACHREPYSDFDDPEPCRMVTGWSTGGTECPLWRSIAALCQTDHERRFLHYYFRYVKDRQFPMLIPQPRIGIAERRRPDFVAFVPLQHWNYKHMAIELDGAHGAERDQADADRNAELAGHGYDVFSVRPKEAGYLEEVRRLAERFENLMSLANNDMWKVAVDVPVVETIPDDDDLPF